MPPRGHGQRQRPCDKHAGALGHQGSKDGVAEAAPGGGGAAGGSGLEELLVHVGAEGPTGGQRPAHKLLCHVPREGATCFQVLGAQGESICRGSSVEGPTPGVLTTPPASG